jgi:hypothetical protein
MATYYVRPDGNDSNTGLGSSAALAWKTVQKALGATGIGSGDTVYIAPGTYRENITIAGTYTAATYIIGDPTAAQFADVPQGLVRLTNYLTTDTAAGSGTIMSSGSKNYLNISYLYFDGSAAMLNLGASKNVVIENCAFIGSSLTGSSGIQGSFNTGVTVNNTIRRCIFMTGSSGLYFEVGAAHTSDWSLGFTVQDCAFVGTSPVTASTPAIRFTRTTGVSYWAGGINIYNCYIQSAVQGINFDCGNVTYPNNVRNCIITNCGTGIVGRGTTTNIEDYNRIIGCATTLTNVASGANTVTVGPVMVDIGMSQLFELSAKQTWFSALPASLNIGFGDPTGALTSDLFGQTWFNGGTDPDAGALTSIQLTGTSYYQPTERNASVMSMQAGSTSRSIYVYLGVTGLTTTTAGLQAYYTKEDGIPVSIPLVAQTPTGAWVAGGFAQVSAINQPGIYRLDIPDAAISAGYNQTVVTVRGASGTNGAVVTIQDPPERGSAIYMGPYKLISNHMGADNPLEVLKGVQAPVDLQLVDNSGGGVDITGATVTAKIYNASSQLIDTYSCTPTYALDGRCSFNLDTTVTDNSGHYTVTVTRQVGGNIVVFGPLRCLVRAN